MFITMYMNLYLSNINLFLFILYVYDVHGIINVIIIIYYIAFLFLLETIKLGRVIYKFSIWSRFQIYMINCNHIR